MSKKPNALVHEASPYLLQHAYNPVDWMPWGEAAFDKARREDKPVFLSIGYATCHWCHVMEHESFENDKIAEYMNEHFVSIKVDREERPDIDAVYMAVTQGLNEGRGGWPMSVWLTPDRQPMTAGTYFPPEDRHGRTGFLSVLKRMVELWKTERDKLVQQAADITDWLRKQGAQETGGELVDAILNQNFEHMKLSFDERYGGFDRAPKFPTPHRVQALLRHHLHSGDADALRMAEVTLDNMARGGIYDHVGGGFHRYSTDREWLTPHFEKMLYDQALLMHACLDLFQITGNGRWSDVVRDIAAYVLRDLRDEAGGFHSAEDADSEGEEGKFYVWTMDELGRVLGEDAELAGYVWGCEERGNYFDESTRERTGANILHLPRGLAESAKQRGITEDDLRRRVGEWRGKLFDARAKRERPLLDDKVVTDWNGLMIGAMARAGAVLDQPEYLKAAQEAADFVLTKMVSNGRLLHRYRSTGRDGDARAGIKGYAEDYAFLLNGLFELYGADFNARWLKEADRLSGEMLRLFQHDNGLLYTQGEDEEDRMIAANTNVFDGAIPSGNSAGAYALLRLGRLLQKQDYVAAGNRILEAMAPRLADMPTAHAYGLLALEWRLLPTREIVVAADAESAKPFVDELRGRFLPRTVVALNDSDAVRALVPFLASQREVNGKPAVYVCENYACQAPVTTPHALREVL
ncbi:MAG: thioredoxin domain-containing protein [Planctomycetes bacterium]|nr:thioredoxin domain-containing protein [Planctomycetota bacterium]